MATNKLSTITIARNEADLIAGSLERLGFADEMIVVVDDRSDDDTKKIAEAAGAKVFNHRFTTFSEAKNYAREHASGDWILDVDADERVTGSLVKEIPRAIESGHYVGYSIPFDNYFFGHKMEYGGWTESHIRLYKRDEASYQGDIHERLVFHHDKAAIGQLAGHMAHFSHRNIRHNLLKTVNYIDIQASELYEAGHPPISWRTMLRVTLKEFWRRTIWKRGYKDKTVGWIEGLYQPFSTFCVYVRLWELQQRPSITDQYKQAERTLDAE